MLHIRFGAGAVIVLLLAGVFPALAQEGDDGDSIVALSGHTLGDQALSASAGFLVPLFFKEYGGEAHPANLSLGGAGEIEWNAYVSPNVRLGLELAGSFARSPNKRTLFVLPIVAKASYVFQVSRFEFPVYLGAGISIVRYREWSHVDFVLKPGLGAYWRYDSNWSFGLKSSWWFDFQSTTDNQPDDQARIGNFLTIMPGLFYHF